MKKILPYLLFCILLFKSYNNIAAIPIENNKAEIGQQTIKPIDDKCEQGFNHFKTTNQYRKIKLSPGSQPKEKSEKDNGVMGILAIVFGLIGLFPAAIVFGFKGLGKNRKLKGLALAGLIMGLFLGLLFVLVLIMNIIAISFLFI